jgi:hypothetical protein
MDHMDTYYLNNKSTFINFSFSDNLKISIYLIISYLQRIKLEF